MSTKPCSSCGFVLEVSEENFYKSKRGKDGFTNQCKPCRNKKVKEWQQNNPDKMRGYSHNDMVRHPDRRKGYQQEQIASGKAKERCKKWRDNNLDVARALTRKWQIENPEKKKECEKTYVKNNPQKRADQDRHQKLKNKYGLTLDQYRTGCQLQENKCSICRKECDSLCVDHNHETDVVRGLLCSTCNLMLGYAHDDPEILRRAIDYLASPPGLLMLECKKQEEPK